MTLFGVACSSANNDQSNSLQESSTTEESTANDKSKAEPTQEAKGNAASQQNLSIGDTATFDYGDTVTVYSYTSPAQPTNSVWTPTPGTQYAAIDVEGCAGSVEYTNPDTGNTQMKFNPFSFALQMPDNTRLQPMVGVVEPALNAANLFAGECLRGSVSFEISQGQTLSYVLLTNSQPQNSARWAIT
jgi:hypothetical protein